MTLHRLINAIRRQDWFTVLIVKFCSVSCLFLYLSVAIAIPKAQAIESIQQANEAQFENAETLSESSDLFAKDTYALTSMVCPFKGAMDYDSEHMDCFRLAVPENRETEASRTIQLNVVKIGARKPDDWDDEFKGEWSKREDPVIYLTGGPGAEASFYVSRFIEHGLRDHRDLYILEQRGIGFSDDFCPEISAIEPAALNVESFEQRTQAEIQQIDKCFKRASDAGVDLRGYNTIENARDVKALRRALGFEHWNVWGISYGSVLGQAYLHEDPDGIRAAVIDAIVPIDPEINFQGLARYYQRALNMLSDICADDPTCAADFPNFENRLKQAIEAVHESPIEINNAIDQETYPSGKATFFHDIIAGLPFLLFYEQDNYPTLPAFIEALASIVEARDYERFRILTSGAGLSPWSGISRGMYNAIACNDGWVNTYRESYERDRQNHPVLSLLNGPIDDADRMVALCEKYGLIARDPSDFAPRMIDTRTIIAEGAMDPITPPPFAKAIMPNFSNGTYVEWPYAGHGPTRSVPCAGDFLTAFFDEPNGELDTSCADDMQKPVFKGSLYTSDGLLLSLAKLKEDPKQIAGPAVLLAIAVFVLPVAFFMLSLSPIARLINGQATEPSRGARISAWFTALIGIASIIIFGAAVYATFEASELLFLVGLIGWAKYGVYASYLAGLLGLLTLFLTIRARRSAPLLIGTLLGLIITGIGGIALSLSFLVSGI
ncbi:alpha/beta hydrolase [Ningiella sp. W23]|uniref:alpha/beta hydrolase n=1 Tax=Ningiella sp. W23 TaxID=3023715 RepID=UPI003757D23E